jgi:lysophospholipase L1-like esterase
VWNQFFAPRKATNLGFGGYRTEHILWNIQHGELNGQSPTVLVLEIGTNTVDEKHYPTRHTAGQLAGGIEAIVNTIRQKLPDTKIIILRCFPGCYGGPNPTSHRAILERASDIVSKLADGKHIFYCDVNHVFLNMDGSINHEAMPDYLHPSPAAAKAWAQAMEPLLCELMGDQSRDTEIPANTAIVPVPKLENDSYNWWDRHKDVLSIKDSINPEIVLIGNSITHFWGGEPKLRWADGSLRDSNGPKSWDSLFHNYRVLNLGFGWDRTQNVLWRLDRGELDGLHPRTVIINIGTNNTTQTQNARMNTAPEIVEGIRAICLRVRSKVPDAKIVLMAIFPRDQKKDHPRRLLINEINKQLEAFANEHNFTFVDIGFKMLDKDGTFIPGITSDYCHPTDKGYQIWADGIRSIIAEP